MTSRSGGKAGLRPTERRRAIAHAVGKLLVVGATLALCCCLACAEGWEVTQFTDNSYEDYAPQVSGTNVVWYSYEGGNDSEIFYYDGTVSQLTDNGYDGPHCDVAMASSRDDSPEVGTWVLLACSGAVGAVVRRRRSKR